MSSPFQVRIRGVPIRKLHLACALRSTESGWAGWSFGRPGNNVQRNNLYFPGSHFNLRYVEVLSDLVFPKWSRPFIEFTELRESKKSLKHELGSI